MTREEQLYFCKQCTNRKFDAKKGVICGLTNSLADFESNCPSFDKEIGKAQPEVLDNSVSIIQSSVKPIPLFKNFGELGWCFIVIVLPVVLCEFLMHKFSALGGFESVFPLVVYHFYSCSLFIVLWLFVGKELKLMKKAIFAAIIHLVVYFIVYFLPTSNELDTTLPFIVSVGFFSWSSLKNFKNSIKFWLIGITIFLTTNGIMNFYGWLDVSDLIADSLRRGPFDFFKGDIIAFDMSDVKTGLQILQLDWHVIRFLGLIVTFMGLVHSYRILSCDQNWSPFKIELGRKHSYKKMLQYLPVLYVSMVFLSVSVVASFFHFLKMYRISSRFLSVEYESSNSSQVYTFLTIISSLVLLYFLAWFYRKLTVEYYLDHGKKLSWGYYFAQLPFIGILFWIYNFVTFKKATIIDEVAIKRLTAPNRVLITIYLVIIGLTSVFWIMESRLNVVFILTVITVTSLNIFYILNKYGLRVKLILYVTYFLGYFLFLVFSKPYTDGSVSSTFFIYLTMIYVLYPVFHAKNFSYHLYIAQQPELNLVPLDDE